MDRHGKMVKPLCLVWLMGWILKLIELLLKDLSLKSMSCMPSMSCDIVGF